jgi:hypothetical protein
VVVGVIGAEGIVAAGWLPPLPPWSMPDEESQPIAAAHTSAATAMVELDLETLKNLI